MFLYTLGSAEPLYCTHMKKVVIKDFKVKRIGNGLVSRAHECDLSESASISPVNVQYVEPPVSPFAR